MDETGFRVLLQLLVLVGWTAWALRALAGASRRRWQSPPLRLLAWMWGLAALALLTAQAYWQLAWHRQPSFAEAYRLDPRPWVLHTGVRRHEVLDRNGVVMVRSEPGSEGVRRIYPFGPTTAHLTGYHHITYGKSGVEAAADRLLLSRSPSPLELLRREFDRRLVGADLSLTVDLRLQKVAEREMARRRGAVVVLEPRSGDILALYSYPAFDPNGVTETRFQSWQAHSGSPFLNRALQGLYPPGSVFKLVTAAAALEAGSTPDTRLQCPVSYIPPGDSEPIRDHEAEEWARNGRRWEGHGEIDLQTALARSANTYFAQLAVELGAGPIMAMARRLGFDRQPVLVAQGGAEAALQASASRLPAPASVSEPGRVARLGIGQDELLVTPFHVAWMTAAIAWSGRQAAPRLLLQDPVGESRQVLDSEVADTLAGMMVRVVSEGTGRRAQPRGLQVAGKTGSAENPHGAPHAWFSGFAPAADPALVVTVVVENGGGGGEVAAPIARALFEAARDAGYLDGGHGR